MSKQTPSPLPPREQWQQVRPARAPHLRELRRGASGAVFQRGDVEQARPVEIDEMGLELLGRMDGNKTLEEIRAEFARDYKLTPLESRALVLGFLRSLHQRGLVTL